MRRPSEERIVHSAQWGIYLILCCLLTASLSMAGFPQAQIISVPLPLHGFSDNVLMSNVASGVATPYAGYLFPTQYRIWVPEQAVRIQIQVDAVLPDSGNVDLYVRRGLPVSEDADYIYSTYGSATPETREFIEITPFETEYIVAGPLFIAIGVSGDRPVEFVLSLSCDVAELPDGEQGEQAYSVNVQYLFCEIANQFSILLPDGWTRSVLDEVAGLNRVAFETGGTADATTSAQLEISKIDCVANVDLEGIAGSLVHAYEEEDGYVLVSGESMSIDGLAAVRRWLIHSGLNAGLEFACLFDGDSVWLLNLTFAPLGYGAMYDAIFDVAAASFHRAEQSQ